MANKTNTTKTKAPKTTIVEQASINEAVVRHSADQDAKTALLIVSLLANSYIFIAWVTLQVTSVYDYQVANFLFG